MSVWLYGYILNLTAVIVNSEEGNVPVDIGDLCVCNYNTIEVKLCFNIENFPQVHNLFFSAAPVYMLFLFSLLE